MLSILNNTAAMSAENNLSVTQANLQKTLTQLSSGLRINSGSDDAAGLSIANGMQANIAALTQSQQNATNGVGQLQTADGALSQVTTLLNRAVTLATEASDSNVTTGASGQAGALNTEFQSIVAEINQIGSGTNFNGTNVFSAASSTSFISDGTSNSSIATTVGTLSTTTTGSSVNLPAATDLLSTANATAALTAVTSAINLVSAQRGVIGASINQLTASTNVMAAQVQNLTSASGSIMNADVGKTVTNMTQDNILESTGMAALQQANQSQQAVLKLLQ